MVKVDLERYAAKERSRSFTLGSKKRDDNTKARVVEAGVGARGEFGNRRLEGSQARVRQDCTIEHVIELHANVQRHPFLDSEIATEVGVLGWTTETAEEA